MKEKKAVARQVRSRRLCAGDGLHLFISPAAINRALKSKSLTKPAGLLKHRIPIRTFYTSEERKLPGFIQIDTSGLKSICVYLGIGCNGRNRAGTVCHLESAHTEGSPWNLWAENIFALSRWALSGQEEKRALLAQASQNAAGNSFP